MAWVIASVPFWVLGGMFVFGSFASIEWDQRTTYDEARQFFVGLLTGGVFLAIAAWVAS